ncbi:MAG: tetratricopeptide repeat protein [Candidatus Accumulibacter sp.]|jgi:tetratricopeptide (TPR) repeat protein|nr:tetratricopeptide repeat protein [Accumulibacter sp.]
MMKTIWRPALVFALVIGLTVGCYWPGLQGNYFLFDDPPNLQELGIHGGVVDWTSFQAFVFNGFSGPTGRPLSLASFLLDDNTWPSSALLFKPTNLAIHLLCGLLLCWSALLLLRNHDMKEHEAQWIAVFSSACWLLHPLMVSTTLYVVQRMAQLAALFVFAGIAGYLRGRSLLPGRPRAAYAWMTVSVGLGTLLAVFSKENGALLPLLLLVVECCLPERSGPRPARLWLGVCLLLPSLALLAYLARQINFSPDLWPWRSFDQPQRLWTETRILWEYLRLLLIPAIEGHGLYQDGFAISRDWLTPWTTLPATIGLLALFCAALWLRRRWPLAALAILFFFAGHLLESSVIGLELYFEHRNYLSAAFLFLPLGQGLLFIARKYKPALALIVGGLTLCLLAGLTLQRARLWQDEDQLLLYWAASNPDSPRAHNAAAAILTANGQTEQATAILEAAVERFPDNAMLNLRLLLQRIFARQATERDFEAAGQRLLHQTFNVQAVLAMRMVVDNVIVSGTPLFYKDGTLGLFDALERNSTFSRFPDQEKETALLKGRLYVAKSAPAEACRQYRKAIPLYADVDLALVMVAEIASAKDFDCALSLLALTEKALERQKDRSLHQPRASYASEIQRIREVIEQDIEQERQK